MFGIFGTPAMSGVMFAINKALEARKHVEGSKIHNEKQRLIREQNANTQNAKENSMNVWGNMPNAGEPPRIDRPNIEYENMMKNFTKTKQNNFNGGIW